MNNKITKIIKLELEANQANPAKVGKDLAPSGINLLQFCKTYNELTKGKTGEIIPAEITIYEDRTFSIHLKTPPASYLLKKYANISKGANKTGHKQVGVISQAQLKKIAKIKLPDLNTINIESAMKIIVGTAKSMGIRIDD